MIDIERFNAAPLRTDPFEFCIVDGFVSADGLAALNADFPKIATAGSFPVASLAFGGGFQRFLDDLAAPGFCAAVARKFAIDLVDRPQLITVRGRTRRQDGRVHTDSATKLITVLIYLNPVWDHGGGKLRLLRDGQDLDAHVAEIEPAAGNLVAFRRSDRSYHGHQPFEGPRRSVQINWLTDQKVYDYETGRHRVSAVWKRLIPGRAARVA